MFDQATLLEKERPAPILTRVAIAANSNMTSQVGRRAVQSGVAVINSNFNSNKTLTAADQHGNSDSPWSYECST